MTDISGSQDDSIGEVSQPQFEGLPFLMVFRGGYEFRFGIKGSTIIYCSCIDEEKKVVDGQRKFVNAGRLRNLKLKKIDLTCLAGEWKDIKAFPFYMVPVSFSYNGHSIALPSSETYFCNRTTRDLYKYAKKQVKQLEVKPRKKTGCCAAVDCDPSPSKKRPTASFPKAESKIEDALVVDASNRRRRKHRKHGISGVTVVLPSETIHESDNPLTTVSDSGGRHRHRRQILPNVRDVPDGSASQSDESLEHSSALIPIYDSAQPHSTDVDFIDEGLRTDSIIDYSTEVSDHRSHSGGRSPVVLESVLTQTPTNVRQSPSLSPTTPSVSDPSSLVPQSGNRQSSATQTGTRTGSVKPQVLSAFARQQKSIARLSECEMPSTQGFGRRTTGTASSTQSSVQVQQKSTRIPPQTLSRQQRFQSARYSSWVSSSTARSDSHYISREDRPFDISGRPVMSDFSGDWRKVHEENRTKDIRMRIPNGSTRSRFLK